MERKMERSIRKQRMEDCMQMIYVALWLCFHIHGCCSGDSLVVMVIAWQRRLCGDGDSVMMVTVRRW